VSNLELFDLLLLFLVRGIVAMTAFIAFALFSGGSFIGGLVGSGGLDLGSLLRVVVHRRRASLHVAQLSLHRIE
jgi:hypothetical protein